MPGNSIDSLALIRTFIHSICTVILPWSNQMDSIGTFQPVQKSLLGWTLSKMADKEITQRIVNSLNHRYILQIIISKTKQNKTKTNR